MGAANVTSPGPAQAKITGCALAPWIPVAPPRASVSGYFPGATMTVSPGCATSKARSKVAHGRFGLLRAQPLSLPLVASQMRLVGAFACARDGSGVEYEAPAS